MSHDQFGKIPQSPELQQRILQAELDTVEAVSYTHLFIRKEQKLDEYKEHKFSDNDRKNLRETGNLGRVVDIVDRETGEIIPVSYTHLDVYKRQILYCTGQLVSVYNLKPGLL